MLLHKKINCIVGLDPTNIFPVVANRGIHQKTKMHKKVKKKDKLLNRINKLNSVQAKFTFILKDSKFKKYPMTRLKNITIIIHRIRFSPQTFEKLN